MSIKETALRLAVLTALRDRIDAEVITLRTDTAEELGDLNEAVGVKALDVTLPDGEKVAAVGLIVKDGKPTVTDEAAWTVWVAANHPTEVIQTVRPAFQKQYLSQCATNDDLVVHTGTGEMPEGVTLAGAGGYGIRITFTRGTGRSAIADAWSAGELAAHVPLVLDAVSS